MIQFLRFIPIVLILMLLAVPVQAQETENDTIHLSNNWKLGGTGTINFSQVSLSNWAAGGQSSLSVLGLAELFTNYEQGKNTWSNSLTLVYGTIKIKDQPIRKSDDQIEINTKYGRKASKNWFYSTQLNFRSQFTPTYTEDRSTRISSLLAPAFITASLGMDYKPSNKLSVFISPVTGKFTFVNDQVLADKGAFGVEPADNNALGQPISGTGSNFRAEFGGYVNVKFKDEIIQNVTFESKLNLFSNYLKKPENVDLSWENNFNFKVNKFISASLFVHMIYDDDIIMKIDENKDGTIDRSGPRLQLRETLGIGLSYKFE